MLFLRLLLLLIEMLYRVSVLTAGNESCPQPQTSEHLAAVEIMKLKHILILQNKIDLVKESQAKEQYEQILAFVKGEQIKTQVVKNERFSISTRQNSVQIFGNTLPLKTKLQMNKQI